MYLQHFGLRELPFSLTPNTEFYLNLPGHQEAYNMLAVALGSGEAFIKLTGEVGTGKTLLCRKLLNSIGSEYITAFVPNPALTPHGLCLALAEELGADVPGNTGKHRLQKILTERLIALAREGRKPVLLIDEAQAMPIETLEAVRLLSNLETERSKLLQIVLLGQPELDEMLGQPNMRQLRQRITFASRLAPIDQASAQRYFMHRMMAAGYNGPELLTPAAIRKLFRGSGGVPRLINVLSHKALMVAYGRGERSITGDHMKLAIQDTEGAQSAGFSPLRWLSGLFVASIAVCAAVFVQYGWIV